MQLKELINKIKSYNEKSNNALIRNTYEFAYRFHKDEKRASGEPFIQHPLNVAFILADLRMDNATIVAALLHDVVEDTTASLETIKKEFGEEVASLVDGVTKLTSLKYNRKDDTNAENVRKMLMASAKDIRVIIIKLADKLHNMRTLKYLPVGDQKRIAKDTLEIYAPLAYRLGIASIKWELEDLSFKYLEPEMYQKFKEKFGKKRIEREIEIKKLKSMLEKELDKHNIKALVKGRPKHFYSIYKKMQTKHRTFEEIHDLIGLRIITDNVKNCYEILGIIHSLWKPIPGEFNDYIAMPKENMYQSLHTAVMALNQPVEFQIRTGEMDRIAEEGIASHWKYKGVYGDKDFDKKLSWLREMLDAGITSENTKEFMEFLKIDFFEDEIYVFSPKGDVVRLTKGSCPIDYAYAVHSDLGDKCTGAIVNGRIIPLRYELKNGDIIKILTSNIASPKRDWLKIVKTTKAKSKIRHSLKISQKLPVSSITKKEPLSKAISLGLISVGSSKRYEVKFAKCCYPVPGDNIVGYIIKGNKISVHNMNCEDIQNTKKIKRIDVGWREDARIPILVKILANDRVGLFADVLNTVAATGTNVDPAKAKAIDNDLVEMQIGFVPENLDHIVDIIKRIKRIKNINKVFIEER